jgi:hypothetical protein
MTTRPVVPSDLLQSTKLAATTICEAFGSPNDPCHLVEEHPVLANTGRLRRNRLTDKQAAIFVTDRANKQLVGSTHRLRYFPGAGLFNSLP